MYSVYCVQTWEYAVMYALFNVLLLPPLWNTSKTSAILPQEFAKVTAHDHHTITYPGQYFSVYLI